MVCWVSVSSISCRFIITDHRLCNRHSARVGEGVTLQQLLHTFFIDANLKLDLLAGFFNYAVIHERTARRRQGKTGMEMGGGVYIYDAV